MVYIRSTMTNYDKMCVDRRSKQTIEWMKLNDPCNICTKICKDERDRKRESEREKKIIQIHTNFSSKMHFHQPSSQISFSFVVVCAIRVHIAVTFIFFAVCYRPISTILSTTITTTTLPSIYKWNHQEGSHDNTVNAATAATAIKIALRFKLYEQSYISSNYHYQNYILNYYKQTNKPTNKKSGFNTNSKEKRKKNMIIMVYNGCYCFADLCLNINRKKNLFY